jgi:hypothetical protein
MLVSELLCFGLLASTLTGAFGWYLRGWYDRRMKPYVEEPELATRLGKCWAASLRQLQDDAHLTGRKS